MTTQIYLTTGGKMPENIQQYLPLDSVCTYTHENLSVDSKISVKQGIFSLTADF